MRTVPPAVTRIYTLNPRRSRVEFNVSQSALTRGIARAPFALAPDGTVAIPDLPGIGVEVDEEFVRAHRVN